MSRFNLPATALLATTLGTSLLLVAGTDASIAQTTPGLYGTTAADTLHAALEPASTGGVELVDRALAKLSGHRRLLIIAAHPDDEDTSLLTFVARSQGGEAAYLSLNRGEGGQNLIGTELGVGLGLIRSRELMSARGIDGARQFFTRAYDFGYTRSLDETFELWPREILLEDAVRVVRRFRPQVIVAIFPGDARAGHGQHQASALIAQQAFELAGDPEALPQLLDESYEPWQPQAFYRAGWFAGPDVETLNFPLGGIDPLTGKSFLQLAIASRSQHRSQDMGRLQDPGGRDNRLVPGAGAATTEGWDGAFSGIDTSLTAMAAGLPEGELRERVEDHLSQAEVLAQQARRDLAPSTLQRFVDPILEILDQLNQAREALQPAIDNRVQGARSCAELIDEKLQVGAEALSAAAGLMFDVWSNQPALVPGETTPVIVSVWNSGRRDLSVEHVELQLPDGWSATGGLMVTDESREAQEGADAAASTEGPWTFDRGELRQWRFEVTVPADAPASRAYFLRQPLQGSLYDWSDVPAELRGQPFQPAPILGAVSAQLDGAPLRLRREAVYRTADQAVGEIRRPLRVVPALEVAVSPQQIVWPSAQTAPRTLEVRLSNHSVQALDARLEVEVPASWSAIEVQRVHVRAGEDAATQLHLVPPTPLPTGRHQLRVTAVTDDGRRFSLATPLVDYSHIRPEPLPEEARVELSVGDIELPELQRVGYVRGASDRVPEALRQIGVPLEILDAGALAVGDLSVYDVIVIGSRAYEIDSALIQANDRLLDYLRAGGRLMVQYQQYQFVGGGYAPLPLDIARPHGRVTDETATVRLLDPRHSLFTTPNVLGPTDWDGWVQERGLYFAGTWDAGYTPLLAMADPGGDELQGSLLITNVGKGTYIYTGLAFFRQLPAGVVGAYRLFANLLAP